MREMDPDALKTMVDSLSQPIEDADVEEIFDS